MNAIGTELGMGNDNRLAPSWVVGDEDGINLNDKTTGSFRGRGPYPFLT